MAVLEGRGIRRNSEGRKWGRGMWKVYVKFQKNFLFFFFYIFFSSSPFYFCHNFLFSYLFLISFSSTFLHFPNFFFIFFLFFCLTYSFNPLLFIQGPYIFLFSYIYLFSILSTVLFFNIVTFFLFPVLTYSCNSRLPSYIFFLLFSDIFPFSPPSFLTFLLLY